MLSSSNLSLLKQKAAFWADSFSVAMVLDSNACEHAFGLGKYELLIAVGVKAELESMSDGFDQLKNFRQTHAHEWMFGWLTYDLKNQLEKLESRHPDGIGFAPLYFFVPQKLVVIDQKGEVLEGAHYIEEIIAYQVPQKSTPVVALQASVSKHNYLQNVNSIRTHIENGDVYELNYCVEFLRKMCKRMPRRFTVN
jgi:para-aminobenzoate synthetase component 1